MPPITVTDVEPDPDGGWIVGWRDDANIGGRTVVGAVHVPDGGPAGDVDGLPGPVAAWRDAFEGQVARTVERFAPPDPEPEVPPRGQRLAAMARRRGG